MKLTWKWLAVLFMILGTSVLLFGFIFLWLNTNLLQPIVCDTLLDPELRSVDFSEFGFITEQGWIDKHFGFRKFSVEQVDYGWQKNWRWSTAGNNFELSVSQSSNWISQHWNFAEVALQDVIRCLGSPTAYLNVAILNVDFYIQDIVLFYPQLRYAVTTRYYFERTPLQLNGQTRVSKIMVMESGDFKHVVNVMFSTFDLQVQEKLVATIRPWPENIEDVPDRVVFYNPDDN